MTTRHRLNEPASQQQRRLWVAAAGAGTLLLISTLVNAAPAAAAGPGLASAATYSVLGGSAVTNTGPSVLSADLGVSPGTAITGFTTATVGGATHAGDAQAAQAQSDLTTAYTVTAGLTPTQTSLGSALVGGVHGPGVYNASSALGLSGLVTLDGQGDPNSAFVFQVGAGFTTATSASIVLIGAAQACNVFWQVGSSATLGTNTTFVGTIMALDSITVNNGSTVEGRALARNGAVTLDDDVFTTPGCATSTPTTGSTASPTPTSTSPSTGATIAPTTSATATSTSPRTGTTATGTTAIPTTVPTTTSPIVRRTPTTGRTTHPIAVINTGHSGLGGGIGLASGGLASGGLASGGTASVSPAAGGQASRPGGQLGSTPSGATPSATPPSALAMTGVSTLTPMLLTSTALLVLGFGVLLCAGRRHNTGPTLETLQR